MIFRTHIAFAFLMGLIFYDVFNFRWYLFFPFIFIGGGFPDIDEPESKFGKKLGFVSKILSFIFKHRGIFHSIFLGVIIGYLLGIFTNEIIRWGFLIGFGSHILIDGFTLKGVNFIYPLKQLKLSGFVKTGSKIETFIFYGLMVLNVLMLAKLLK